MQAKPEVVGVVVIGRNEGERLRICLASVLRQASRVVYVDSGSSDGSRELARGLGADVIELDLTQPFTAARARNVGWRSLSARHPEMPYVQFVDGDCELDSKWIGAAREHLDLEPKTAVACGRRRERHPEASVYNRLCDVEWNTPVGRTRACGGDALMRVKTLADAAGFDERLIAGEEPELCFRLRERGWHIERLDAEMTLHDAAMSSVVQWWRRCRRAGHSFASLHFMHGSSPERFYRSEVRSVLLWAFALPVCALLLAVFEPLGAVLLLAYPMQVLRLRQRFRKIGIIPAADCMPYALSCVCGKFPNLVGVLGFHMNRLTSRRSRLIEYK